jgi:hypothetical protein
MNGPSDNPSGSASERVLGLSLGAATARRQSGGAIRGDGEGAGLIWLGAPNSGGLGGDELEEWLFREPEGGA